MIKITKKQNVVLNGSKYIAAPRESYKCGDCQLQHLGECHNIPCNEGERKDNKNVRFFVKGSIYLIKG